jgi:hypothetical protein
LSPQHLYYKGWIKAQSCDKCHDPLPAFVTINTSKGHCHGKRKTTPETADQTNLTRNQDWTVITQVGYRHVRQVAIDSTWSAVRFRSQELKKEEAVDEPFCSGYTKYFAL